MQNGIEGFCKDLESATASIIEKSLLNYKFKSFDAELKFKAYEKPTDQEIFDMFFLGNVGKNTFIQNEEGRFSEIVNRSKLESAIKLISEGGSLILHSDLGNGKTLFLKEVEYQSPKLKFLHMKAGENDKLNKELKIICEDTSKKVVVIDSYNLRLNDFEKFKNFDLTNVQFILLARTAMHENCSDILYELIDQMQNVTFQTYDLNRLGDDEIVELNTIISKYGFWGEKSHLNSDEKEKFLKENLKGKFQNILLYLFKEGDIKNRFEEILKNVSSDKIITKILILTFVNEILELKLIADDFNIIFDRDNVDRIIRRRKDDLGELIDYHSGCLKVKSSIISKGLIVSSEIQKSDILDTLFLVVRRLDTLYEGIEKYKNALKNLASASYLSFIFDYEIDNNILISYFEKIKETKFNKNNLFFGEQYAITCVNVKEFSRAEKYFQTAYALAKNRGRDFSTFQIDNHYARFLLENQIYARNPEKALDIFMRAHKLLLKATTTGMSNKYYQFRVAILYKEYYDIFFERFEDREKKIFLDRCQEMKSHLQKYMNYMKINSDSELRKYIYECKRNLDYILTKKVYI